MATQKLITTKSVLGYLFMPRIWPRTKNLFSSSFGYIAFLMAQIYSMVRLLPQNHAYLKPENIGSFGLRHVIAEAANHLVLKKENFDQIIIFFAMLAGVVLLALQTAAIVYSLLLQPAIAQTSIFETANPQQDLALTLIDRVFGIPNLNCNTSNQCTQYHDDTFATTRTAFHIGLHSMFQFYSLGILIIAVLIFLYYVIVIVGETAITGSPFGQRFANIWVPIRLVMALGLLVPLNYGLNSAQYITLYAAKFGSGLATNGWGVFNRALADPVEIIGGDGYNDQRESVFPGQQFDGNNINESAGGANPSGENASLVSKPESPDLSPVIQFIGLVHTCAYAYWKQDNLSNTATLPKPPGPGFYIKPYLVKHPFITTAIANGNNDERKEATLGGTSYKDALEFYNNGKILIRFGRHNEDNQRGVKGNVEPICGEIIVHTSDVSNKGNGEETGGPDQVQAFYYDLVLRLWEEDKTLRDLSHRFAEISMNIYPNEPCNINSGGGIPDDNCDTALPPGQIKQEILNKYNAQLESVIEDAWNKYRRSGAGTGMTKEIFERGWGGAGIWYNTIAKINGGFVGSVANIPSVGPQGLPESMREVKRRRSTQDTNITGIEMYCPNIENGDDINMDPKEIKIAQILCNYYKYWNKDSPNHESNEDSVTGNAFEDAMTFFFGLNGLFNMREDNISIHPLAQLSGLGKSLVDMAVRNIGGATVFSFGGGIAAELGAQKTAAGLEMASQALSSIAFIGLTVGFILFYIMPFMPFIYFFFAVGTWIKTIFEAMVGVPLWALAHLRLDGEGLPGDSAANGYFLIFDIFVRPILTVFGLIAAIIIFTMQVRVLHFIWDLVLNNLSGFESIEGETSDYSSQGITGGVIDEFFYTVLYAIIVYMLGTASFKLIDKVPDNILRWMGTPASALGDMEEDTIGSINRYAAFAGMSLGQQATSGLQAGAKGAGQGVGGLLKGMQGLGKSGAP